jgi:beta-galactosidase
MKKISLKYAANACGFAKDNYYYYKSWWSSEKVLHIFPDWNQPDKTGKPLTVYCYSNADEVELFVNGISQGRKKMIANWYLKWDNVIYQPGKLHAIGYWKKEDATIDTMETAVETTGAPYRIVLEPQMDTLHDTTDIALVNVSVQDEKGRIVPWADPQIRFHVENGILVGCGNGNPGSHESDKSVFRRAFHGLCQIAVQVGDNSHTSEPIMIRAMADGLLSGTTALTYSQGAVYC